MGASVRCWSLLLATSLVGACAHPPAAGIDALAAAVRSQPLVLLGEVHDNPAQHALRAQALQRLLDGGARPALLMEQFDRERQPALDQALARPGATADAVIAAATPAGGGMQGWSWPFYKPYIALAIAYRLPIVAANVSRDDARRVSKEGLPALGFEARVPADVDAAQARAIVDSHCGMIDSPQAARMVGAQVARDQFMARMLEAHAGRGAVLLAGNGHVRRDIGVPRWLSPAARARSVSIGLLEPGDMEAPAYDVAIATPATPDRPDPCEGLRAPPRR